MTEMEKAYFAKFYEIDGPLMMGDLLKVEANNLRDLFQRMKRNQRLEYYRSLWDKKNVNALERM